MMKYEMASPEKKRKLVDIVASNLILKDGSLHYHYRKPFNLLVNLTDKEDWWATLEESGKLVLQFPYEAREFFIEIISI